MISVQLYALANELGFGNIARIQGGLQILDVLMVVANHRTVGKEA